jgi:ankyrin repeat protein
LCELAWQADGNTALLRSCAKGHVDIVRLLLDRSDVDVKAASVSGARSR